MEKIKKIKRKCQCEWCGKWTSKEVYVPTNKTVFQYHKECFREITEIYNGLCCLNMNIRGSKQKRRIEYIRKLIRKYGDMF